MCKLVYSTEKTKVVRRKWKISNPMHPVYEFWKVVKLRSDQIMAMSVVCSFFAHPYVTRDSSQFSAFLSGFWAAISARSLLRNFPLHAPLPLTRFSARSALISVPLTCSGYHTSYLPAAVQVFYREELAEEPFCRYYAIHRSSSTITIKAGVKLRNYYFASFWKLKNYASNIRDQPLDRDRFAFCTA